MTGPAPIDRVLPLLVCPHCGPPVGRPLARVAAGTVGCASGHRFDLARQGYLPLLGGGSRTDTGDDAVMVAARERFLAAGHFDPIADAVAARAAGTVLEVGAGTGHYLARCDPPLGIALDSSRYAARRAARAHPRVAAVLADAWAPLPVASAAIDTVLVIFAPRVPAEIGRVLRPGGTVLVVTPGPEHLQPLRDRVGMLSVDPGKAERVRTGWGEQFVPVDSTAVRADLTLERDQVRDLIAMGPAARHLDADRIAAAADATTMPANAALSVEVTELRRRPATAARGWQG